jgi:hypothetical protein
MARERTTDPCTDVDPCVAFADQGFGGAFVDPLCCGVTEEPEVVAPLNAAVAPPSGEGFDSAVRDVCKIRADCSSLCRMLNVIGKPANRCSYTGPFNDGTLHYG